ncbi:MAG: hypothetical protein IJN50_02960 [Clostridia bacterium]|nr:hypothetical protein [Clostridia bacterium]
MKKITADTFMEFAFNIAICAMLSFFVGGITFIIGSIFSFEGAELCAKISGIITAAVYTCIKLLW